MPKIGVQIIGEIDGRRAYRQFYDARLRRHDINMLLGVFRRAGGSHRRRLFPVCLAPLVPGEQLAYPGDLAIVAAHRRHLAALRTRFFIAPVSGHSVFGELMHFARADLDLEGFAVGIGDHGMQGTVRSEEHTSELQSLMRDSYAVFCLKKKTKNRTKSVTLTEHYTISNEQPKSRYSPN